MEKKINRSAYILCVLLLLSLSAWHNAVKAVNRGGIQAGLTQTVNVKIDGAMGKLSAVIVSPVLKQGEYCPMVILMHGFTSNKEDRLISAIGDKLLAKGIASIRFDFNGHGESDGEFQHMTVLNEIEDAKKVYEYVRSLPWVGDISLLGHSQGGVVAAMTAGELGAGRISRLVLMAPAAVLRDDALNERVMGVTYDPVHTPEYVLVSGHRLGRNYIKSAQTLPIYETAARYSGPVCVIHGKADAIVPFSYGERFKAGYQDCELHLLENEDHAFNHCMDKATDIATEFLITNKKLYFKKLNAL